jgi:hypothetical protein
MSSADRDDELLPVRGGLDETQDWLLPGGVEIETGDDKHDGDRYPRRNYVSNARDHREHEGAETNEHGEPTAENGNSSKYANSARS